MAAPVLTDMTSSSIHHPELPLSLSDFAGEGRFSTDQIAELTCGCTTLFVIATETSEFTALQPVCSRIDDNHVAVFYSKAIIESVHDFFVGAFDQYPKEDVTRLFFGTLMERTVDSFLEWKNSSRMFT